MDLHLKGKRAVVLGGTRGIGRAIAEGLMAEGASLAICARSKAEVEAAVATLKRDGTKAYGETLDIAVSEGVKAFVGRAADALGGLDIAVANASAATLGNTPAEWKAMLDIDILGLVSLIEAAQPFLEKAAAKHGDAAILAISSVAAVASPRPSAYGAMKGALIHLVKGYARNLAANNIRVNAISPGATYFEGGYWAEVEKERPEDFKSMLDANPLGRMATPYEIADAALFLVSSRATIITGANLIADGAYTTRANY
jgi:3-oxoacyl-[acyl-carrier protein] reductase